MRKPQDTDQYPQKIKAKRVAKPCFEVDRDGKPVPQKKVE
jgi:hypothetical protein